MRLCLTRDETVRYDQVNKGVVSQESDDGFACVRYIESNVKTFSGAAKLSFDPQER